MEGAGRIYEAVGDGGELGKVESEEIHLYRRRTPLEAPYACPEDLEIVYDQSQ
jgi:hypothetical protein